MPRTAPVGTAEDKSIEAQRSRNKNEEVRHPFLIPLKKLREDIITQNFGKSDPK
jgi:hypothetical protein